MTQERASFVMQGEHHEKIKDRFDGRRLNAIGVDEWRAWVDALMAGRKAEMRERFLNGVVGFLNFARRNHGLAAVPEFERDKKARNPNRRTRRRTEELRPDLIRTLFDAAHISLRAQLAVEYATGSRVSSNLYGVRLCDLNLGKGREQITFRGTKNGEDVTAALNTTAVAILQEYLEWRGNLNDREAPLFLTYRREPYTDNGRAYGGQKDGIPSGPEAGDHCNQGCGGRQGGAAVGERKDSNGQAGGERNPGTSGD